jgi:hypothetical protein
VFHDSQKAGKVVLEVLPIFISQCKKWGLRILDLSQLSQVKLRLDHEKEYA